MDDLTGMQTIDDLQHFQRQQHRELLADDDAGCFEGVDDVEESALIEDKKIRNRSVFGKWSECLTCSFLALLSILKRRDKREEEQEGDEGDRERKRIRIRRIKRSKNAAHAHLHDCGSLFFSK